MLTQGHEIGTCTDAVGRRTSSVDLMAQWSDLTLQATRAHESHLEPDSCSPPRAGFRVSSEAHIRLANGRSHLRRPHICARMTLTVLTATEASFVRSGCDVGKPHPEMTFETMLRKRFEGMSQSLPREQ